MNVASEIGQCDISSWAWLGKRQLGGGENFVMSSNIKTREKREYLLCKDKLNPILPYKESVQREKLRNVRLAVNISLSTINFSVPPLADLTFLLSLTFVCCTFFEISYNVLYLKFKRKQKSFSHLYVKIKCSQRRNNSQEEWCGVNNSYQHPKDIKKHL